VQVAAISRSPRTSCRLTAEPGTIGPKSPPSRFPRDWEPWDWEDSCVGVELPLPPCRRPRSHPARSLPLAPSKPGSPPAEIRSSAAASPSRKTLTPLLLCRLSGLFSSGNLQLEFSLASLQRQIPHLEHLLDRRDPRDRFFAELADPVRKRSRQLAVDIHRAAAHPCDHAGVLRLSPCSRARIKSRCGPRAPRSTPRISTSIGSGTVPSKTVQAVPSIPDAPGSAERSPRSKAGGQRQPAPRPRQSDSPRRRHGSGTKNGSENLRQQGFLKRILHVYQIRRCGGDCAALFVCSPGLARRPHP
jgi:hypothetical protein